ncbi:hypothetical protein B0J17DRAFT_423918 [Rhizoctonia solani]|nr:hypothetical protein B0J17DRAFT_423918 [Rhizoctonia solani]
MSRDISIIHSSPRDRYQWGVIISRILMGSILALLLLLNLGKYQQFYVSPSLKSQRARVFNWLEAGWILPTIALAYGIQFLVEFALAFFAKRATVKAKDAQRQTRAEAGDLAMGEGGTGVSKIFPQICPGSLLQPRHHPF